MNVEPRIDYLPGDPFLIKNIVTQLKSQGVFDQFRKECITDVDTKPAYQNLCHLVDTQVSKYLSKVKWGPDLNKTQLRENIRRHVNECNFVEPGIAIIVDQLVNPRINTVLVPKVEDIVYDYLGIHREKNDSSKTNEKPTKKKTISEDSINHIKDDKKDIEKPKSVENKNEQKTDNFNKNTEKSVNRDSKSNIKTEIESSVKDAGKTIKEPEKIEVKVEEKEEILPLEMDTDSSDDEISPPYELHEKSDVDMSTDWNSTYSEIIENPPSEIDVKTEQDVEKMFKTGQSKIITEHEDSMDSIRSNYSSHSPPEKLTISPIEIPKTPTINYETSDDSDDYLKKKASNGVAIECSLDEPPEINFDKIVEKVVEINPSEKIEVPEVNISKEDDKFKDKKSDDKKKYKPKEPSKSKPESKEKDRKHDYKDKEKERDKDRDRDKDKRDKDKDKDKDKPRHDKYKSEHKSRDKEQSRHDSKSHKKDDKQHRSKDRDSKSEHKSKDDKKSRDEDRKHKDDKDKKKDHRSSSSSKHSDKSKKPDDKYKHDKKDHSKSKKDDSKKSRSHCNIEERKRTDRRSSDRDSSGPSSSNLPPSLPQYSSKTEKDKSTKHKHSSSSHKSKKNDNSVKTDNQMNEDDLEMILESSDKIFDQKTFQIPQEKREDGKSDHIEDMMNEMFHPEPKPEKDQPPVLKKPKIAKNFADIHRIMKLRKLYKESCKLREEQGKENAVTISEVNGAIETHEINATKLRKTVDYFVTKRFGINGNSVDKCVELTNAIMETLTDVQLNITRVDRRYSIVDGTCLLNDEKGSNGLIYNINSEGDKKYSNDDLENLPLIIKDERANLIFEDLAKTYINHDEEKQDSNDEIKKKKHSEEKVNGSKTNPTQLNQKLLKNIDPDVSNDSTLENNNTDINIETIIGCDTTAKITLQNDKDAKEESSPLKLKIKSTYDGKNKMWACNQTELEEPVYYFTPSDGHEDFKKFVENIENQQLDVQLENIMIEMDYPECYDQIFRDELGAIVTRKICDDGIKYNSEIINKKTGDKSIMLRIKKSSEQEEVKTKKKKVVENDSINPENETKKATKRKSEVKRKTLGVKRSMLSTSFTSDSLSLKVTASEQNESEINETDTPVQKENQNIKGKLGIKKVGKLARSISEDTGKNLTPSSGINTHIKNISDSTPTPTPKNKSKNANSAELKINSSELSSTNVATTTKTPEEIKKSLEEKKRESIMKCYYDASDLYKPRPSFRFTSRRSRLGNTENV